MNCSTHLPSRAATKSFAVLLLVASLLPLHGVQASDYAKPLRQAQALLAKDDYAAAYAAYLEQATAHHNPLAAFSLALFHENGWGRPVDRIKACNWYKQAAEGDVPTAAHAYAECLVHGIGRPVDAAGAAKWYRKAANLGHFYSLCPLARLYMDGRGVAKQPAEAIAMCRSAAERGSPRALYDLGVMLLDGDTSVRNPAQALAAFQSAVQAGIDDAAMYIGRQYEQGLGVDKDMVAAANWYEYLAAKGDERAYLKTGAAYWHGPRDPKTHLLPAAALAKAYLWLSAAAQTSPAKGDRAQAEHLLQQVEAVMPASWKPDLDAKLAAHLAAKP